jgi:O-antigen ligase
MRSGRLRAEATAGQAIPAGLTCAVAIGLFLSVRPRVGGRLARLLTLAVLLAGGLGAFSRAPWVGAAMIVVLFLLLGPKPLKSITYLGLASLVGLPILVGTDAGKTIIDHLPWIGTVDARSVEGRDMLFDVAIQVVAQYPWFGRFDFYELDSIQALRGGDGMIDIVNTYLLIALKGGVTSLAFFLGAVCTALWGAIRAMRTVRDKSDERYTLGCSLVVTMLSMLMMIGTTSPISFIYPLLWALVGMSIAYTRLVEKPGSATRPVRFKPAKAWA